MRQPNPETPQKKPTVGDKEEIRKGRNEQRSAPGRSERADHSRGADYEVSFEEGTAQAAPQKRSDKKS